MRAMASHSAAVVMRFAQWPDVRNDGGVKYLPLPHTSHRDAPAALVAPPIGHASHDALPAALAKRPAAHAVHVACAALVCAAGPCFPAGHRAPTHDVRLVAAPAAYVPLGHAVQRPVPQRQGYSAVHGRVELVRALKTRYPFACSLLTKQPRGMWGRSCSLADAKPRPRRLAAASQSATVAMGVVHLPDVRSDTGSKKCPAPHVVPPTTGPGVTVLGM